MRHLVLDFGRLPSDSPMCIYAGALPHDAQHAGMEESKGGRMEPKEIVSSWFAERFEAEVRQRAHEIVEVLSDCSNELYLNALAAKSLRATGRERIGRGFWVRSEWNKVDISYGVAAAPFKAGWDRAWWDGTSGDTGVIEAKVCYQHLGAVDRIAVLRAQLEQRRQNDIEARGAEYASTQRYHGLVWLYAHDSRSSDHGAIRAFADGAAALATGHGLWVEGRTTPCSHEMPETWPTNPDYRGDLTVMLVELGETPPGRNRTR